MSTLGPEEMDELDAADRILAADMRSAREEHSSTLRESLLSQ